MVPVIRPAIQADEPFLWQMLLLAAHLDDDGPATLATAKTHPALSKYVHDWGRETDAGCLALDPSSQQPIGAAWMRLFNREEQPLLAGDEAIPELAIAVLPAYQGQGVGMQLLTHAIQAARARYSAVVLSVRTTNSAKALYERVGFVVVGTIINRVGTMSWVMRIDV